MLSVGRLNRREFLRVGGIGAAGLTLADILRAEARGEPARRGKSLIYIVLAGGPSHIDMWDLKPGAPREYRGPFLPIATRLSGVGICEHMPRQAELMDRMTLIRGVRSVENDHFLSEVYTGLPRTAGKRPAFGSLVSRLAPTHLPLPTYVALDRQGSDQFEFEKPHYAGAAHAPFRPFDEALNDLKPVTDLDALQDRKTLLEGFDTFQRTVEHREAFGGIERFQAKALEMISSPKVRDAFDITREPPETLVKYGHKRGKYTHQTVKTIHYDWDARPFVLARRLVEAGVRVVTLQVPAWDHHGGPTTDIFYSLKLQLPALDASLAALVDDLHERGLSRDVLVVVLGEFGRTPKITPSGPGREHWADAGCALFFGGGLRMGQVVGATDARAERSLSGQIGFENIIGTIYHVLGVNLDTKVPDFNGRPQHLLNTREPIRELL